MTTDVGPADTDAAGKLLALIQPVDFDSESLVSGTGVQLSETASGFLYLDIAGGSAGTVEVQLSPDGTTYTPLIAANAANAVSAQKITVRVPCAWFVKITLAVATIAGAVFQSD